MNSANDTDEWSLEGELRARAGLDDLPSALRRLGLLEPTEGLERIVLGEDWYRRGSETYLFDFQVCGTSTSRRFLLKACVALGSLDGTAAIATEWLRRRKVLEREGVDVPVLYGLHRSTILEEFIAYSLPEALLAAETPVVEHSLVYGLGKLAGTLTRRGFPAVDLSDLRSRGTDVVVVDFGEDLGPPGLAGTDHTAILHQAVVLASTAIVLGATHLQTIDLGFGAGLLHPGTT